SETKETVNVSPLASKVYRSIPVAELLKGRDPSKVFLHCELLNEGLPFASNTLYFRPFKDLSLPAPNVSAQVSGARGAAVVTLSSGTLARGVYLSAEGLEGSFADNFFDLLPGRKLSVEFRTGRNVSAEELRRRLRVRTLSDAFAAKK
ncbi:MAG TPA: glycoside hydrolase family 2 protein, partial [Pyrinomonadaceae bacterium]